MPGKDGRDLFASVRADAALTPIPVAFTTGDIANPSTVQFAQQHRVSVLAKPEELVDFVEAAATRTA